MLQTSVAGRGCVSCQSWAMVRWGSVPESLYLSGICRPHNECPGFFLPSLGTAALGCLASSPHLTAQPPHALTELWEPPWLTEQVNSSLRQQSQDLNPGK